MQPSFSRISALTFCAVSIGTLTLFSVDSVSAQGPARGASVAHPTASQGVPVSFSTYIAQNGLTQTYQTLTGIFPKTTTGAAIARVATLAPNGLKQDNVPAERQLALDLAVLRNNADQALTDLQTGFKTLPEKYWPQRQFLIQTASHWPVSPGTLQAFLESEISRTITRNPSDPTDLSGYTPAIAIDSLSNIVADPVQLHDIILRDLQAQPDKDVRRTALVRYEAIDAVRAGQIATQLGLVVK